MTIRPVFGIGLACAVITAISAPALAGERLLSEMRIGALTSVEKDRESGGFVQGMLLADPFGHDSAEGWSRLALPRLHVGTDIATGDGVNQIYAGFSWTADLGERLFLEAGFGGALHDGRLSQDGTPGPKLGCRALFHEYLAAGLDLDSNWRIVANIGHSSHADLCDGPNNGLTRAGLLVGYKF